MDGVTAIAQILHQEGVDFIGCVPYGCGSFSTTFT
jgi:hypothetical protein